MGCAHSDYLQRSSAHFVKRKVSARRCQQITDPQSRDLVEESSARRQVMSRRYFAPPIGQQQSHGRPQSFAMGTGGGGVSNVFSSPQPQPLISFDQDLTARYGDTSYGQSSFSTDYDSTFGSDGFLATPVRGEEGYNYDSSSSYDRGMQVGMGYLSGMNMNGSYSRTTLVSTPQLTSVDLCQREAYRPTYSPFGSVSQERSYAGRGSPTFRTSYGRPFAGTGYDAAFRSSAAAFPRSPRGGQLRGRKIMSSSRGGAAQSRNRSTLYCELCKVSCVGQQAYDEHVKGQRHAKREAQTKIASATADAKGNNKALHHCKICNVFCTGTETLKAHQRGVKHMRAVKLQETMGKKENDEKGVVATDEAEPEKMEVVEEPAKPEPSAEEQGEAKASVEIATEKQGDQILTETSAPLEKETEGIGEEYLTLIPATKNKAAQLRCRLCNCEFSDLQAKETHLKGRRHRLNLKKTVEAKGDKRLPDEKHHERFHPFGGKSKGDVALRAQWNGQVGFGGDRSLAQQDLKLNQEIERYNESIICKAVKVVEPLKEVTNAIYSVSQFVISNLNGFKLPVVQKETADGSANAKDSTKPSPANPRALFVKVVRVGNFANGIAIRGENRGEVVAVCHEMPTIETFEAVEQHLASKIEAQPSKKDYSVNRIEEPTRAIVLRCAAEPAVEVYIRFGFAKKPTPTGKDAPEEKVQTEQAMETEGTEERQCAEALVAVRRTDWFEDIRSSGMQMVLQIIRYLRSKEGSVLSCLSDWAWQVLLANVCFDMDPAGPTMIFTALCEKIASGLALPKIGIKLLDPCGSEKRVDLLDDLTQQQRFGLTTLFQKCLNELGLGLHCEILKIDSEEACPEKEVEDDIFDGNGEPKRLKINDDGA